MRLIKVRTILFLTLALSLVLGGAALAFEKEVPPVRKAIDARNQLFMAAYADKDAAAMAELYTETALLLPPDAPILEGKAEIQAFWQALMDSGIDVVQLDTLQVDVLGNTANEVSHFTLYLEDGEVFASGKYIVVWKRVRGEWYLHWDIFNFG